MRQLFIYSILIIVLACVPVYADETSDQTKKSYDTPPTLLDEPEYTCPKSAQEMNIKGFVDIRVSIDTAGVVTDAKVKKCSNPMFGFEEAALRIARSSTFKPATKNNIPVDSYFEYRIEFSPGLHIKGSIKDNPASRMDETEDFTNANDFVPVDEMPQQIYEEIPRYPRKAQIDKISGYVIVQVYVDDKGTVTKARALKCSSEGYGFEEAAVKAAYKCRYKPATQNGKPIGFWISYRVSFTLEY